MNVWNFLTRRQEAGESAPQVNTFGGIAQQRVYVGVNPQVPPDQPRQGVETPSRPARMPIAILTGMNPQAVEEGRFVHGTVSHIPPHAAYPLSRQMPDGTRVNIAVPPHVAYGSLFTSYAGHPGATFHD